MHHIGSSREALCFHPSICSQIAFAISRISLQFTAHMLAAVEAVGNEDFVVAGEGGEEPAQRHAIATPVFQCEGC